MSLNKKPNQIIITEEPHPSSPQKYTGQSHVSKYSTAYREILGLTKDEALEQAKLANKQFGIETFVYFQQHDPELGDRYNWTTDEDRYNYDLWVQDKNIIWGSTDGYYR